MGRAQRSVYTVGTEGRCSRSTPPIAPTAGGVHKNRPFPPKSPRLACVLEAMCVFPTQSDREMSRGPPLVKPPMVARCSLRLVVCGVVGLRRVRGLAMLSARRQNSIPPGTPSLRTLANTAAGAGCTAKRANVSLSNKSLEGKRRAFTGVSVVIAAGWRSSRYICARGPSKSLSSADCREGSAPLGEGWLRRRDSQEQGS